MEGFFIQSYKTENRKQNMITWQHLLPGGHGLDDISLLLHFNTNSKNCQVDVIALGILCTDKVSIMLVNEKALTLTHELFGVKSAPSLDGEDL